MENTTKMNVVITKQPTQLNPKNVKIFFYPKGSKSQWYNMTDNVVRSQFKGPGEYVIESFKHPTKKYWIMLEMTKIGDLPRGYQVENHADMDTFCFDLLNMTEDKDGCITMTYCSSFDVHRKPLTLKLCDQYADEIYGLGFKLKLGGKYKVSRSEVGNGKMCWLFSTMKIQDENIDKRKSQWEAGKYKDKTTSDNLEEFFGF